MGKITCPCCGYKTYDEEPGDYIICPVCFWEDDPYPREYPDYEGGANRVSLKKGQQNFIDFEACKYDMKRNTRLPNQDEPKDTYWKQLQ